MADTVRVRFAPSPTGELHIGGARTAIYNWAFARRHGRHVHPAHRGHGPRALHRKRTSRSSCAPCAGWAWIGTKAPNVGGEFGPYLQTQRFDTYTAALEELKARGAVYPCFCTKEELDAKRAAAEATEGGYSGYDRTCRSLSPEEAQARIDAGEPHVWRLKVAGRPRPHRVRRRRLRPHELPGPTSWTT